MMLVSQDYGEVSTLQIDTSSKGGFTKIRGFTEMNILLVVPENGDPFSLDNKNRSIQVLNHFLDIYRLITQDSYVHRIDDELDLYLIDYSVGRIPDTLQNSTAREILLNINNIEFPKDIGDFRQIRTRLNTLEDLFPGKILELNDYGQFSNWPKGFFQDDILDHIAILEAAATRNSTKDGD